MDRVFLDGNILFSAAYRRDARLRRLWELSDVKLLTSAYAVEEARRNLDTLQQRADLVEILRLVQVIAVTPSDLPIMPAIEISDKDRPILLTAIAAQATHLLTGDVRHFGRYYGQVVKGVLILPPAQCMRASRSLR